MKLLKKLFNIVPAYAVLPLIFTFSFNMFVYVGAKLIAGDWYHYNIETALDASIPFVPWTVSIYLCCYAFWVVNYILSMREGRESGYRFVATDIFAKAVCLVFYLVFPTTNTRPVVGSETIWDALMCFLYSVDSADNLFPSIHCLVSWLCYIGIRKSSKVSGGYKIFSCAAAVAVFVSTLTTKQHVLADVAGGAILAELCWWIAGHTGYGTFYGSIWERVNKRCPIIRDYL